MAQGSDYNFKPTVAGAHSFSSRNSKLQQEEQFSQSFNTKAFFCVYLYIYHALVLMMHNAKHVIKQALKDRELSPSGLVLDEKFDTTFMFNLSLTQRLET